MVFDRTERSEFALDMHTLHASLGANKTISSKNGIADPSWPCYRAESLIEVQRNATHLFLQDPLPLSLSQLSNDTVALLLQSRILMTPRCLVKVLTMQASQGCAGKSWDFRLAAVPCIGYGRLWMDSTKDW